MTTRDLAVPIFQVVTGFGIVLLLWSIWKTWKWRKR
jgi:hypothetical protein